MDAERNLERIDDHIRRFNKTYGPTCVRSTFTNCQGTIVNRNADADDVRDLITRVIDLAFESLHSGDHKTIRISLSSSDDESPFVAEIASLPSSFSIKQGQFHEH